MYFYENNSILIVQFSCIVFSLLSIIGVIIVFLLGKGWKYFIATLFFTQIICMLFFYIPQLLFPFIYVDQSSENNFCQFKTSGTNQLCISDTFCKWQGYFINSSFLASTMISLYTCYIIKQSLNANSQFARNVKQIYLIHMIIGILTFSICLPMLIVRFEHYGTTWGEERIYYICNMEVSSKDKYTQIIFWLQTTCTIILIIFTINFHLTVKKLKKKIKVQFENEFDSCSSLNLYILPLTLLILWSINMILKLIDSESNFLIKWGKIAQAFWFFPQTLLALQGFNYAQLFFYAFYIQLVPNLPKPLQKLYMFFARISIYNLIFGKIVDLKIHKESLLYDSDSAKESTLSYIQKDDSSTNR